MRWPRLVAGGGATGALWLLRFRLHLHAGQRARERRMEEELAAYAGLDARIPVDGEVLELARRVSRLMAGKSAFRRAAMLVRDAEERLFVAASAGLEDFTVELLNAWGERVVAEERSGGPSVRWGDGRLGVRVGGRSFAVVLGEMPEGIGCRRAIVTPLWTTSGRLLGVLAVGADGLMSVRRSVLGKTLEPLEALAFKVERAMENAALAERLLRAEKLAGLGLLAGGMAHALNNPLTAVLGFAELIADTTGEARVKEDAGIIVREALRMRQTVETLQEFCRPPAKSKELVDVTGLVRELAGMCVARLEGRGIRLVVQAEGQVTAVRGNRGRLRQMLEHLLNNAAEALGDAVAAKDGEERVIRLSVGVYGEIAHLLVSDTGPGFPEPGRVFRLGDSMWSAGLGLSVCYGIVREHGGEISAFNLYPHGAAVSVELPVVDFAVERDEKVAGETSLNLISTR